MCGFICIVIEASQPAHQPASQPACQPTSQPANQPTSQPSQPSQPSPTHHPPATQPASHRGGEGFLPIEMAKKIGVSHGIPKCFKKHVCLCSCWRPQSRIKINETRTNICICFYIAKVRGWKSRPRFCIVKYMLFGHWDDDLSLFMWFRPSLCWSYLVKVLGPEVSKAQFVAIYVILALFA